MLSNRNWLTVLIPLKKDSHPYLKLLYEEIEKYSEQYAIKVLYSDGVWCFNFIKKVLNAKVIHLHWIEQIIRSRNLTLSFLKFLGIILLLLLLKIQKKVIVITLHNIRFHEKVYAKLEEVWFRLILGIADAIIVHNNYSLNVLTRYDQQLRDKIYVIPHGNFVGYYPNDITQKKARKILGIPEESIVMLYFGQMRDYKGVDDLIAVFNDLLKEDNNLILIICGKTLDEKTRTKLLEFGKRFQRKCIMRLGYIPDDEVQIYMNASDIGILPYKEVTTSGALILFQSFARTVIAPDLPPIKEVLGDAGIYFKRGDREDMKASIIRTLNLDKKRLRNLGQRAFVRISKLDWDKIARATLKVYLSLISRYCSNQEN